MGVQGDEIRYQEGKLVRNWAGTFEARTEQFYTPETEEEVVKVDDRIDRFCCWMCADDRLLSLRDRMERRCGWWAQRIRRQTYT